MNLQTKTYDQTDLERLASRAPNAHVAAAILGGKMATIRDGDVLFVRPGLDVRKHFASDPAMLALVTKGSASTAAPSLVTKSAEPPAPPATPAKRPPTKDEIDRAAADPSVSPAQFREMLGYPPGFTSAPAPPAPTAIAAPSVAGQVRDAVAAMNDLGKETSPPDPRIGASDHIHPHIDPIAAVARKRAELERRQTGVVERANAEGINAVSEIGGAE